MNKLIVISNTIEYALGLTQSIGLDSNQVLVVTSLSDLTKYNLTEGIFTSTDQYPVDGVAIKSTMGEGKFIKLPSLREPLVTYIKSINEAISFQLNKYSFTQYNSGLGNSIIEGIKKIFDDCNITPKNGFEYDLQMDRFGRLKIVDKSDNMTVIKNLINAITIMKL